MNDPTRNHTHPEFIAGWNHIAEGWRLLDWARVAPPRSAFKRSLCRQARAFFRAGEEKLADFGVRP